MPTTQYLELQKEIKKLVEALIGLEKVHLAEQIWGNWNKTCLEYSKELNAYEPDAPLEPEMRSALDMELRRLSFEDTEREKILSSLSRRRVLNTAPHVIPALGPRMLATDWIGSLGVPKEEFYTVGMFSGIPFSNNSFWPGRIENKNGKTNLVPSTMQDSLVYQSRIPGKLTEQITKLPERLREILPEAVPDASYTKWALGSCQRIQKKILGKDNLVYFDINEVAANYLSEVLRNPAHLFHKLFFNEEHRKKITDAFPNTIIFYAPIKNGKYQETESLFFSGKKIKGKTKEIALDPETVCREITDGALCPATFLVFTALAFLNRFKCLGSFAQVEYLPAYQKKLSGLDFMNEFDVPSVPTANLTLGAFPNENECYPADLIAEGRKLEADENLLWGEFINRMKSRLLENYATDRK